MWRWFRLLLAVVAALVLSLAVWIGWLLSGQRYQQLLVEQLSDLFGAQVQMESSHLSFSGGIGVRFAVVTVKDEAEAAPFFTAAEIDLLLDLPALWHGDLLFHRVDVVKPTLQIEAGGKRLLRLLTRLRAVRQNTEASFDWFEWLTRGFSPALAVRELRLRQADISYVKSATDSPLLLQDTEVTWLSDANEMPTLGLQTNLKNKQGPLGHVSLRATAAQAVNYEALEQSVWAGEVECTDMMLQQLGRVVGEDWPSAKFALSGRFSGKGTGPLELNGVVSASGLKVGEIGLSEVRLNVAKASWSGPAASFLRSLTIEAQLEQLQGTIGKQATPVTVSGGEFTLQDETLTAAQLSGKYGRSSQFSEASVLLRKLLAKGGPVLDARMSAEVDLQDDLPQLLTALTRPGSAGFSETITQPRGRARVRVRVQHAGGKSEPVYDGLISFQQAGFHLPSLKLEVNDLSGDVKADGKIAETEAMTFRVGQSWLTARGKIQDFFSARRSADFYFTFNELADRDVAPFLPSGKVFPQGGTASGALKVSLAAGSWTPMLDGRFTLQRVRIDMVDFLHPAEVIAGEMTLSGQGGTFVIQQAHFPGGAFTGRGRIESWEPLRMEVIGDFPELDFSAALALDKPDDGLAKESNRDIRADMTSKRMTYKGTEIENLRLLCHWHHRQADLRIVDAQVAKGHLQGEVMLWPDIDAAYLAPQIDKVDAERFFRAVGVKKPALSGTMDATGKIHMPDWARWDDLELWDAQLSLAIKDGVAQRLPILIRLWSVLSMQGLLQLQLPSLPTEGLPFTSLTGDLVMGKGTALTRNLSLHGSSVRLDARGKIDLAGRTLDMKTALVPLHGLTSSVAKVPLAGELLARSADYLTTLKFQVSGSYDDPSVTPLLVDLE